MPGSDPDESKASVAAAIAAYIALTPHDQGEAINHKIAVTYAPVIQARYTLWNFDWKTAEGPRTLTDMGKAVVSTIAQLYCDAKVKPAGSLAGMIDELRAMAPILRLQKEVRMDMEPYAKHLLDNGMSNTEVGKISGMSVSRVCQIKRGH